MGFLARCAASTFGGNALVVSLALRLIKKFERKKPSFYIILQSL